MPPPPRRADADPHAPDPTISERDVALDQTTALLENCCGWCFGDVGDRPIKVLPIVLQGNPDLSAEAGRVHGLNIGGRLVVARVPLPASHFTARGYHVVIMTCGDACAHAVMAALRQDQPDVEVTLGMNPIPYTDAPPGSASASPAPEPTERDMLLEQFRLENELMDLCSWCRSKIVGDDGDDSAAVCLTSSLTGGAPNGHLVALVRVGEHQIHGMLGQDPSDPDQLMMWFCSQECADALEAAAEADPKYGRLS